MADAEGRKTVRNCLRGLPERVFPVGNLEYAASGLVFLTNDGDLAADVLKHWAQVEQVYQVKVKGMLTLLDLERLGKEIGVRMQTVRQAEATRGRGPNTAQIFQTQPPFEQNPPPTLFLLFPPPDLIPRIRCPPPPLRP